MTCDPRSSRRASPSTLVAIWFAVGLAACGGGGGAAPGDVITVGLLLPFTGASSATASNFERAVLYAADRINAGGGVHGRRVRVVSGDTHSDVERSRVSTEALIEAGAVVVLGPESSDIAAAIGPALAARGVVFLSPLVGAANETSVDCTHPWFRLAPSARSLGEALAKLALAADLGSTAVLFATGSYDAALGSAASTRFTALGGRVSLTLELEPGAQTYASAVRDVLAADPGSIVLATSTRSAALVINELDALSATRRRWFLSPLLKTEVLVENVAAGALEGALGVAPKIYDATSAFPDAFERRWKGDQPLEGAYFYYDAMGLLAFALEKAIPGADGTIEVGALEAAIFDAAAPPGEAAGWDELESGLARLRAGSDIYYSGLTGPMLLESCGPRRLGVTSTWQIQSSQITDRAE